MVPPGSQVRLLQGPPRCLTQHLLSSPRQLGAGMLFSFFSCSALAGCKKPRR
nr:MAG TPA: hypothetical protein [Caudoviricetes sp.]